MRDGARDLMAAPHAAASPRLGAGVFSRAAGICGGRAGPASPGVTGHEDPPGAHLSHPQPWPHSTPLPLPPSPQAALLGQLQPCCEQPATLMPCTSSRQGLSTTHQTMQQAQPSPFVFPGSRCLWGHRQDSGRLALPNPPGCEPWRRGPSGAACLWPSTARKVFM